LTLTGIYIFKVFGLVENAISELKGMKSKIKNIGVLRVLCERFYLRQAMVFAAVCLLTTSATAQDGFTTTKSGLQYRIDNPGNNRHPQKGWRVWLEYTGRLDDGTVFGSTDETGNIDIWLGQGQVIKGWEEALPMIGEGGHISLIVPPHLGYGDIDTYDVPRNSTLHFDIKMIQADSFPAIEPFPTKGLKAEKLACGIRRYTIDPGNGSPARAGDNVYVHYTGWLPDGTIYTSTRNTGKARRFTAGDGETFEGMDTALLTMAEGARCRLVIPSELAFGKEGYGNRIPPKTDITLDIEMVRISRERHVEKWNATGLDTLSTASGLRYIVFEPGNGSLIKDRSIVTAHYSVYLPDGKLIESSVKRESPIRFPVGTGLIIDGWEEASLLMRNGSRFQLIVPARLAYGDEGQPPLIPANTDLIFDVEVLDVIE